MIRFIHRFWNVHFAGNPLLRREVGLWEGRSRLRSPLVIMLLLAVLVPQMYTVASIIRWKTFGRMQLPSDPADIVATFHQAARAMPVVWDQVTAWTQVVFVPLLMIAPLWFTARAWARESEPAQRDQLGASPITVRQVIGAKALVWMAPPLEVGNRVAVALWAPRDSILWMQQAGVIFQTPSQVAIAATTPEGIAHMAEQAGFLALMILAFGFSVLFGIGISTRLNLAGLRPEFCAAITLGIALVVIAIPSVGMVWVLNVMLRLYVPEVLVSVMVLLVQMLAAWRAWRGLPRRVAERYGMAER